MHGMTEEAARVKAQELSKLYPENRYVVMPHSWTCYGNIPKTWGVGRYVPYCESMPERFDGFVWFEREKGGEAV